MLSLPEDKYKFLLEKIETLKGICSRFGLKELSERLDKLRERLESPFLITVFGEVNAGKSSFLNALLGIPDLCRTDIDICTDRITVIKYCENPKREKVDELTEEVCVQNPLLKGFTVVDTPGINSVLEHHTYITEKFLPRSDVILVILPALNPHTKPIWDWISQISHQFGKKLLFILQQKDLLPPDKVDLLVERVKEYAHERGIAEPKVFAVSALKELKGEPDSGFAPLREFLKEHYTGQKQIKVKLLNIRNELLKIAEECLKKLEKLEGEAQEIERNLREVLNLLDRRIEEAQRYKRLLSEEVDVWVSSLTDRVMERLDHLPLWEILFRKKRVESFLEDLRRDIERELDRFVKQTLIPKVELFETGVLKPAVEEAAKRLEEFNRFFEKLGKRVPPAGEREVIEGFHRSLEGMRISGGEEAVALIGGSLLAGSLLILLSGSFLVDITGGVIAALGTFLGWRWLQRKKQSLRKELRELLRREIGERLKSQLELAIERRLDETLRLMKSYLEDRLRLVEEELKNLREAKKQLLKTLSELKSFNP